MVAENNESGCVATIRSDATRILFGHLIGFILCTVFLNEFENLL